MDNSVILFDIDHTLLDTDKLRSQVLENVVGLIKSIIRCNTADAVNGILIAEDRMLRKGKKFIMGDLIDYLGDYYKSDRLRLELGNLLSSPELFSSCLYPDARIALDSLSRHFPVGVFSSGDVYFQKIKLRASGIEPYFRPEHINILERKTINIPRIIDKYRSFNIAIVDDRASVLEAARQLRSDVVGIWVNRGKFKHEVPTQSEFSPHYQVRDLQSIPKIFSII